MQVALFYANWEKFYEPWSTPLGLRWELESRGHDVRPYNLYHADGMILPKHSARTYSAECWNQFGAHWRDGYRPDVVLVMDYGVFDCMQMNKQFFPNTLFILEAGDTPQSFRMHAQKAHKFHGILTPDRPSCDLFNSMGIPTQWWTHYGDERIFQPQPDVELEFDCVTTCGGRGEVTTVIKNEFGDQFENSRYYFGVDHAKQLCRGCIVFQKSQWGEITRRIFEGMACGKMVITDRLSDETGLSDLFINEVDIVYYDSAEDAIEKIRYYATHDDEREKIALAGYQKVMKHHTVANRVDEFEEFVRQLSQTEVV